MANEESIHGYGKVFDEGVARGVYTDARGIVVVVFRSTEDDGYIAMFRDMPTLSAHGATREEALLEFCVMAPTALASGLLVEQVDYPLYMRTPSGATEEEKVAVRERIQQRLAELKSRKDQPRRQ